MSFKKPIDSEVRKAFKEALNRGCKGWIMKTGYRSINLKVDGKWSEYLFHRLVFACHYEMDPGDFEVDHVNTIRSDNSISNLRLASGSQNGWNAKLRRDSKTGVKGVTRHRIKEGQYCWRATIRVEGNYHRKYFPLTPDGFEAAVTAVQKMRTEHHGKFGRAA